ncbi:MAG TPA: MG2 domain-containing protein, partial [Spirochaetales bacterium]|nr:MG2 domain-containing protein [Spirochaetales bacterium]
MDNHGQTQKKPRGTGFWTTAIAAALCVLAGAVSCARTETLASSGAAGPLPTVVVAPASEDMPLLVRWPEPVASPPLDTALIPEIGIEPLVEGTFTWRDSSTLSFAPVDGRWVGGERFTVSVPELSSLEGDALPPATLEVDLGYFSGGGKSADWAVQKGAYRLVSSLYLYEHDALGARPAYFLYDQAIPVKTLGKYVKVRLQNGKDVPFKVFTPRDLDKVFGVSIPEENVLAVEITSFPADGSTVVISLPDWGNVKPGTPPGSVDRSFTIARNFEIEDIAPRKLSSQGRLPLIADLSVSLSRGFDMDQFRKALTIKPAPEAMDVYGWEYGQALIRLSLKPGVSYSLRVAAGLEDYLGNRLARAVDYSFRAQDLPPELVAPAYPITVEARSGSVPLKYLNLGQLTVRAYTFASASAYVQALESRVRSAQSAGLRALSAQKTYKLDSYVANERKLSDIVMENAPGFRLIEIEGSGLGSEAVEGGPKASVLYNSTAMGVTVKVHDAGILAWVASFADGKPVPGADLRLLNTAGQEVGKGVSDKNGLATLSVPEPLRGQRLYVVASLGADSAIASVRDDELSSAWQFNLAGPEKNASKLSALVYTERGVYRPAESVMIKAYVARQDVLAWKGPFTVKVVDPRGKTILDKDIQADAYGSLDTSLELGQHADVGRYSLTLGAGDRTATGEFRVEEYRVPSFMVRLEAQGEWKLDARALMGVSAAYYHGGSLEGRAYWYRVTRESAPLSLSRYPGYVFGLALPSDEAGTFLQGDGRLDGSGKTVVAFDPHHSAEAGRVRYTVEVRVQDVDNQAYVGLASKVVDSTTLYVGHLPPVRSVLKSNERLRLPLVVVNKDGSPVAGAKIEISWDRIEYHQTSRVYAQDSVQTTNRPVSAASGTATLTSKDVPVAWNYLPPTAGVYKVRASVRDPATGAYASTETVVTVGGDETAGWPRFDMERIDVVRDKDSYVSGDTARLVVESPYDTAVGLLCIERDRVLEAKLISFDGDTPVIELPIKDHYAPNVYVSVVIVRGRAHFQKDALGYETGAPGFKLGYVELPVSPESKRLSAEFTGLKDVYQPGSRIRLPVTIKDAAGRPVQAQFAVAVVDEAVLALTGYRTPDPLPPLYKPAGLSVRTAASWLDLPHSRRERFEAI